MAEDSPSIVTRILEDNRLRIARRDVASLSREKTIVLALIIQLFIAAFASFLVVGLTSMYDPGAADSEAGAIEVAVSGDARQALQKAGMVEDGVKITSYETRADAESAFDRGDVSAVVHGDYRNGAIAVTAIVPEGSIESTLAVVRVRSILEELERSERRQNVNFLERDPIDLPPDADSSPTFGFTYTILIPLLLFLPPFLSGSIAVDAITEEIERGTLELLRVAPVSLVDIVDGKAFGMAVLAPIQALLWITLLLANGIAVQNVGLLVLLVSAISVMVVVVGVVLGLLTAQRQQGQLLYSILVLGVFVAMLLLPEHPTTIAAKLAVGSPTDVTVASVFVFAIASVLFYGAMRRYVRGIDPERY